MDVDKVDETADMDPLIETYHDEYVKDLSWHLGINDNRLPPVYTIMALLNPMFAFKPIIVDSG